MKTEDKYLRFVQWNEEDGVYVGYCPDLFPWGGVCHGDNEETTYHQSCVLVLKEVEQLRQDAKDLPLPATRPMREVVSV